MDHGCRSWFQSVPHILARLYTTVHDLSDIQKKTLKYFVHSVIGKQLGTAILRGRISETRNKADQEDAV